MRGSRLEVIGARANNLQNVDVSIPHRSLTVITGVSGSGKSSLAFDTIFAEGQRRYIETFSPYARTFLGGMARPDVDQVKGLNPVISIEQKTTNKNPRSTVGTVTEIYDYLRLLYARTAIAYSPATGEPMVKYTEEQVLAQILSQHVGQPVYILAPIVRGRKGHYREVLDTLQRKGYLNARIDGEVRALVPGLMLDRYRTHSIEVVVDKLVPAPAASARLRGSLSTAMRLGDGRVMILEKHSDQPHHYSKRLVCPQTGESVDDPTPGTFSFNSPEGACPHCKGLGSVSRIDLAKIIADPKLSIANGALLPLGKKSNAIIFLEIEALLSTWGAGLSTPVGKLPAEAMNELVNGSDKRLHISARKMHAARDYYFQFEGLGRYITQMADDEFSPQQSRRWAESFASWQPCPHCQGKRLRPQSLAFRIDGMDIATVADMELGQLQEWLHTLPDKLMSQGQTVQCKVAEPILEELTKRTNFLTEVGLDYLSLSRPMASLSGGESQRIRLATQIGARLVNVTYILDEPSIGLHQRDNQRLIRSLKALRDIGNTVIVVEHDRDMMLAADYIIDIGPGAGAQGGRVLFQGPPAQLLQTDTLTAKWLRNEESLLKATDPVGPDKGCLTLRGCTGNNLKGVQVAFPLGKLISVTGVSGSGKSTLVCDTLLPIISQHLYRSLQEPLPYAAIEGMERIDKVVSVDQSPIGRTPRSNPATYTGVLTDIRNLFARMPEAQVRGYKPGRFSFNVRGGRCEECAGNGYKVVAMNFLPSVQTPCPQCRGGRFNRATLEVRFKGKSIADVLNMTVRQAVAFFENQPQIKTKLNTLLDVGLPYLRLGQPSNTLSGGESQRIKLAAELSRRGTGRTLYILDEPTTGLHFADINALLAVLRRLVQAGNTVILIEHNIELIAATDHVIELGPGGGWQGGEIIATGSPQWLAAHAETPTAQCLKDLATSLSTQPT